MMIVYLKLGKFSYHEKQTNKKENWIQLEWFSQIPYGSAIRQLQLHPSFFWFQVAVALFVHQQWVPNLSCVSFKGALAKHKDYD